MYRGLCWPVVEATPLGHAPMWFRSHDLQLGRGSCARDWAGRPRMPLGGPKKYTNLYIEPVQTPLFSWAPETVHGRPNPKGGRRGRARAHRDRPPRQPGGMIVARGRGRHQQRGLEAIVELDAEVAEERVQRGRQRLRSAEAGVRPLSSAAVGSPPQERPIIIQTINQGEEGRNGRTTSTRLSAPRTPRA
jgi:hypothetical protein